MSEYFRVLKRLERDRLQAKARPAMLAVAGGRRRQPVPPLARAERLEPEAPERREAAAEPPSMSAEAATVFATLFDNIRACTATQPVRTLVFAGVSAADPTRAVIGGLRAQAERHNLTVSTGKISHWGGGRTARRTPTFETADSAGGNGTALLGESGGSTATTEGTSWPQAVEGAADLVLIEGPPLDQSIDAVLLGRASDGLVIVARTGVTARAALANAAERAKAVGCRTLGIVLQRPLDHAPPWLRWALSYLLPQMPA